MTSEHLTILPAGIYQQIFEYAADPIFVLDMGGCFIEVNQAACDHVGYSREELLRMGPEHLDDATSREKIPERLAQLRKERQATFEAVHIHRDGTRIPVEMHIRLIEHEGKTISLTVCRDISERLQKEVEYQQVVQTTADGFWINSVSTARLLDVNDTYCKMVGYTRDELLSMHIFDIEAMESPEETRAHIQYLLENGHDIFETKHRHKDGHLIDIEISVTYSSLRGGILFVFARDISERKRIGLEISKARLEAEDLYNNAPCGYHSLDAEGRVIQVNQTELDLLGYERDELIGKKIRDFLTPSSVEAFAKNYLRFKQDGYIKDVEYEMVRKDGTVLPILLSANAVQDADGNFLMSRSTMIDISERKRRDEEVKKSRAELQELYDKAPCGYHSLDQNGRITRINQTEADWLGYEPHELIGKKITDFHTPSSAEIFTASFARFKWEGYVNNIEVGLVRRNGETFTALLSSKGVYDPDGNYLMNRTTMLDITERKQAEAGLRDSEERFRQLFERAPIGIAMAKQDQKIFDANAAYCKMFGYSLEELRHLTITDLTHPDYVATTREMAAGVLAGEFPVYSMEKKYLRKDGGWFWGQIIAAEIAGHDPQARYVMGIVEDITERIVREEHRLTEVIEQRDVLVREVHHRIKNNLQGVVGLLRQHAIDHPEMAEVVQVVIGRIHSIAIIHGLQAQTTFEEVDLDRLIASIVEESEGRVEYQGNLACTVFLSREEAVPVALVLNELITNACKHRAANSMVAVKLETAGEGVLVTVANHFDERQHALPGSGQGLKLVKSLLPRKSADLVVVRAGDRYTAELKLSPPVTMPGHNETH